MLIQTIVNVVIFMFVSDTGYKQNQGEIIVITGLLKFKNKSCVFKLQVEEFILEIEEIEERENVHFSDLSFLFDNKSKNVIQENLLVGIDFETKKQNPL